MSAFVNPNAARFERTKPMATARAGRALRPVRYPSRRPTIRSVPVIGIRLDHALRAQPAREREAGLRDPSAGRDGGAAAVADVERPDAAAGLGAARCGGASGGASRGGDRQNGCERHRRGDDGYECTTPARPAPVCVRHAESPCG